MRQPVDLLGFLPNLPAPAWGFSSAALAQVTWACKAYGSASSDLPANAEQSLEKHAFDKPICANKRDRDRCRDRHNPTIAIEVITELD